MPVVDVDAVLKDAIEKTLDEVTSGEHVAYHLSSMWHPVICEGDEDNSPHQTLELVWRVNLFISFEGTYCSLNGMIPYGMCCDADPEPMAELVRDVWSEYSFRALMHEADLKDPAEDEAKSPEE